ncbi:MAG: V-type ATP synthase subunit I [Candidatus Woesearchaeota archaeon]
MFTKKLNQIYLIGNNAQKKQIINKLQNIGSLHISTSDLELKNLKQDKPLKGTDELSLLLLKIKYLLKEANIKKEYEIKKLPEYNEIKEQAQKIISTKYHRIQKLSAEKTKIKTKIKQLNSRIKTIEKLPFKIINDESKSLTTLLYSSRKEYDFSTLNTRMVVTKITAKKDIYFKITLAKKDKEKIIKKLSTTPLKRISISFLEGKSDKYEEQAKKQIAILQKKLEDIYKKINIIIHPEKLLYIYTALENYYKQHIITTRFQTSHSHFIIKAYVEHDKIEEIKKIKDVTIYKKPEDKETPTKLENKGLSKNFEKLTELFSLPKYGYIDPTKIISLFYPIFFGLMLSDIGYGLMLLLLSLFIKYKFQEIKKYANIMITSSIATIISGFIFGSFFGELIPITPLYQNAFDASFTLLIASLIIGLIHLNLAVILKAFQLRTKKTINNVLDILILPLIQITVLLFFFSQITIATISLALLIAILIKRKSILGLMDITGFFGTWFSYARILALNLATSGVALAVNLIAQKTTGISIILYITILILGHIFNFVINLIGCTINAARLHYVEFFSIFYESGGKEFKSFSIKKINTM